MAHLPTARAVNQATVIIAVVTTATIIEGTNAIAMITDLTTVIKTTNVMIALNVMTRTQKVPSPMTRRMIASAITPRKRATRPCIMTSPLSQAPAICPEKKLTLFKIFFTLLILSCSCSSIRSYDSHHVDQDDRRSNPPFKRRHSYSSKSDNDGGIHRLDKSITVCATFSAPKAKKKRTQK